MDNNKQGVFIEALNSLKEFAKVNGGIVTKADVLSYFKNLDLDSGTGIDFDEAKLQMVYGYLMANNIRIKGEDSKENEFLKMMEKAQSRELEKDEGQVALEEEKAGIKQMEDSLDYEEDDKNLKLYLEELQSIDKISDTSRAYLLMNIAEDNDKESLKILTESFLEKIVEWIKPYARQGVLSSDLVQEANLCMTAYMNDKRFLNNFEWREKIKEGSSEDILKVMSEIEEDVHSEVKGCLQMLIDEQLSSNRVSGKVLGKVNLVNDWAVRLSEELGRKPTIDEVAEKMGISSDNIKEAIRLSAETIEKISYGK
ncbi:MAG: sigma-70 domain-containing protein [Eubacteriales bacterium]|nr:sigma-70 domain-containing protein [Eubacteriales bacterium]